MRPRATEPLIDAISRPAAVTSPQLGDRPRRRTIFRRLPIALGAQTMIPRSSALVDVLVAEPEGSRTHEVGTGSGAVALAAKHERPDLHVSASDISPEAVAAARANARELGLCVGFSVADGVPAGRFDLVVANLPYLTRAQRHALHPELENEPDLATIVSGDDPLEIIRSVVERAPRGMRIALQHPLDLARDVERLLVGGRLAFPGRRPSVTVGLVP